MVLELKPLSATSFYEAVRRLSIIVIGVGALGFVGVGGELLLNRAPWILSAGAVLWLLSVVRPTISSKKQHYTSVVDCTCGRVSLVAGADDRVHPRSPGRSQQHELSGLSIRRRSVKPGP